MEFTAAAIAEFLKGEITGDPEIKVTTIAKIEEGHKGALSFLANPNTNILFTVRNHRLSLLTEILILQPR